MSAEIYIARLRTLRSLQELGHQELMDVLGRYASIGPLVRLGLLRRREDDHEFQRYHGYIPTEAAATLLLHNAKNELIMVRKGAERAFRAMLKQDPEPDAPFKEAFAECSAAQFLATESENHRDDKSTAPLRIWLLKGYMHLDMFCKRHSLQINELIAKGLCIRMSSADDQANVITTPTTEAARYLFQPTGSSLILIRPGMELPLYQACSPENAEVLINLPQTAADVARGSYPRRASWV